MTAHNALLSIAAHNAVAGGEAAAHIPSCQNIRELLPRCYQGLKRRSAFLRRSLWASSPLGSWGDNRYEARRSQHAANLPRLCREHAGIVADLGDTGVAIRTLELPSAVLDSTYRFTQMLCSRRTDEACVRTTSRELAMDPSLFMWGLSEDLLDLAECHIGLPPRYLGVEVKREIVGPAAGRRHKAVRRWHLDHEDRRILKVIVYLSDVDSRSAPFGYVDLPTSEAVLSRRHHAYAPARLDEVVRAEVPPYKRIKVTGPRMTAIYVDTGRVLHRVFPPLESERYSVTFAFCSRSTHLTYSQLMLPAASLRKLHHDLSPRQWEALCRKDLYVTPHSGHLGRPRPAEV
jgi:hypothetical protein